MVQYITQAFAACKEWPAPCLSARSCFWIAAKGLRPDVVERIVIASGKGEARIRSQFVAAWLCLSSGAMVGAQARLRDPFVRDPFGLQVADTGGATSRALRAAPILPGWVSFARRSIAGTSFIFIRGVTAQSVGAAQTSYFVYQVVREDSVRLAFIAPFREYSGRAPETKEPESELRACLFIRDTTELGYLTMPSRTTRYFTRPPLPRGGYYKWSADHRSFVRRADGDALLGRQCAAVDRIASK